MVRSRDNKHDATRPPQSPKEFLRGRRPEQFSDTTIEEDRSIDRTLLEYHLSTITNRSQEADFARFAHKLAQKEICPNLLPQTGPTGGGDSKVDSETYPVADILTHAWYVGVNHKAASERWAFAFSAKKDWRSKVKSDVEKLTATRRKYTKAFFITSQFVRDKDRAEVEDALTKTHALEVRILDRTWIMDKVFTDRHELLAIEELHVGIAAKAVAQKGPLDTKREIELEKIEDRIRQAVQDGLLGFALVEDCIEASLLARGLERPRSEVEGLLRRARENAEKFGTHHQRLICAYNEAWTAFWWFEDYNRLADVYKEVETHAKETRNAYELELLGNLLNLLRTAVGSGWLTPDEGLLKERRQLLTVELERLSKETERPSTALQARTLLLYDRLHDGSGYEVDAVFADLEEVLQQTEGLLGYPFRSFATIFTELGEVLGNSAGFVRFFEKLVAATSRRDGEVSGARMLVERGEQLLRGDRPYEAIRTLGRCLRDLHKHESRKDIVHALYLSSFAYERVGLLWAARGTILRAASVATNEFWTYQDVTRPQLLCYNRLRWLELQLGRVPHVLEWHELVLMLRQVFEQQGHNPHRLGMGDMEFDACLGILLLRSDTWTLKRLERLPDVLERLHLFTSAVALWYALGYEEKIPDDLLSEKGVAERLDFFRKWRDQPAAGELPTSAEWYDERTVTLRSVVLGCRITVDCANDRICIETAESTLGAIEAFMATMVVDRSAARVPSLSLTVRRSDLGGKAIAFEVREVDGMPRVEVACRASDDKELSLERQNEIQDVLADLVAHICARVFIFADTEGTFRKLVAEDRAMERAVGFAAGRFVVRNVLGDDPKLSLDRWLSLTGVQEYPLRRSEEWDAADRQGNKPTLAKVTRSAKPGSGQPPPRLADLQAVKHGDIGVLSLIREPLWDEAGWNGVVFGLSPVRSAPPVMALLFHKREAGSRILELWQKELGLKDEGNRLRVSIIRGIRSRNPSWYRVIVGSNAPSAERDPQQTHFMMMARLQMMSPNTDRNLRGFLDSYRRCGQYVLSYAVGKGDTAPPSLAYDHYLIKSDLTIREAWEVGPNDLESAGVLPEDDPIIPRNMKDAPVHELLRLKRSRNRK